MPRTKRQRFSAEDFHIEWALSIGKQDGVATGVVRYHGLRIGAVKVPVSKFRADYYGYDKDLILSYAARAFLDGINNGRYKEIADGLKAKEKADAKEARKGGR